MISINVLNKNIGIDEDTFQPFLDATVTIKFPLEAMRDGLATGELNKLYTLIGKTISDKLTKE